MIYLLLLLSTTIFVEFPPVRETTESGILGDILSHSKKNKDYDNPVLKVHENAHFANNTVNSKFAKPGYYILNNKCILLDRELPVTVNEIARNVPHSLRTHPSYDWYLVKLPTINSGNNIYSSVIFDELVAYTHGCRYKVEMNDNTDPTDIDYMLAFSVYSVVALMSHDYDKSALEFVKYQLNEVNNVYKECDKLNRDDAEDYLHKFLSNKDCERIRSFMKQKLGFEF